MTGKTFSVVRYESLMVYPIDLRLPQGGEMHLRDCMETKALPLQESLGNLNVDQGSFLKREGRHVPDVTQWQWKEQPDGSTDKNYGEQSGQR